MLTEGDKKKYHKISYYFWFHSIDNKSKSENYWGYFDFDIIVIYLSYSRFILAYTTKYGFLTLSLKKVV